MVLAFSFAVLFKNKRNCCKMNEKKQQLTTLKKTRVEKLLKAEAEVKNPTDLSRMPSDDDPMD